MEAIEWINVAVKILFLIASAVMTVYVVPWLKEKHLYGTVVKCVQAAEKYAKTHNIDKKEYVIAVLESKGVTVSVYVDALIESAVQELDIALGKITEASGGENDDSKQGN